MSLQWFAAFVAVGRIPWNLRGAMGANFQPKPIGSDVLVHHLG